MSEQTAELKHKITGDFVLELYEEAKEIEDPEIKRAKMAVVEVLSQHIGEWLVLDED